MPDFGENGTNLKDEYGEILDHITTNTVIYYSLDCVPFTFSRIDIIYTL